MRLAIIVLAAIALAGCDRLAGGGRGGATYEDAVVSATDAAASATDAAASAPAASAALVASPKHSAPVPAGAPMLAYSYNYGIETGAEKVAELAARHEAACTAAGASVCQVISSSSSEMGGDGKSASLNLRATPLWLKRFRDGLDGDARSTGGHVIRERVESEDLSREIVDTEARLRAQTTLRDRLQALLADRPGKLSDLVEIERELARVQGDIDSAQSQLNVMRGRVQMSSISIHYSSPGLMPARGPWGPLASALRDFVGTIVFGLAMIIRLIAVLIPWVLLGAGIWWLLRKRLPAPRWPFRRKPPVEDAG